MSKIEIYTRPGCGYCNYAKRLLENKELSFDEYDVYKCPEHMSELKSRTKNRVFPQIFIDGRSIGSFSELLEIEQSGELCE